MRKFVLLTVVAVACGDNKERRPDGGVDAPPDAAVAVIGPEMAVDDPVNGNTGQNAFTPYIAFNGTSYLAVWSDTRISRDNDIFAARIGTDGTIMDATGITVSTDAGKQTTPVVAWVSDRWLVVWNNAGDIDAATITSTGTVTQLSAISTATAVESLPAIASSGATAVVAWQSGQDIVAAQWSSNNFAAPFNVANTAAQESDPAVAAASATQFLVVYSSDNTDIRGQRVTSGALTGASFEVSPTNNVQNEPAAAFNGTDYLVTFNNGSDVFATRVNTSGALQDGGVAIGIDTGTQSTSSIGCDASACYVTWADSRAFGTTEYDIYGARVSFDLSTVGTSTALSGGTRYQVAPNVAAGSSGWLAAWEDNRTGGATLIIGSRVANSGSVTDTNGLVLNTNKNLMQEAAVATGSASSHLVVWSDSRALGNDIEGVRYSGPTGAKIDRAEGVSEAVNDQAAPSVTFDGTEYLVVWSDARNATRDIYASRYTTNGTVTEPTGIPISTAARDQLVPDVVSGGGVSLVVWQDRRNGDFDVYGAIINTSGAIVANDIAISLATNDQNTPAVAYDSGQNVFIVVWSDNRSGTANIFGARVSPAGMVLDANGVQVSNGANGQFRPDVAIVGGAAHAVWDDRRNDAQGDIYGTRLALSATALTVSDASGIAIITQPEQQSFPTIVGMPNRDFALAWTDNRNLAATGSDIYGILIAPDGQPRGSSGFVISDEPGNETLAALENGSTTVAETAIVYQGYRSDTGTTRVFRRTMFFP